ncbi:MAG: aminotransferase class I/II-fold pyridoxal phosphate-dependent enzyme [Acidobacteria bacterium]|nr:aminotransferase class I/II-fold pyridoxal phosphate-dependent enzyme [Acidobacteriota bacterium]MBI3426571.1 aminotransferase class I/II-fold pyridoxal phosphate-dependent enzyme [Acidobacteriota bacterium]
MKNSVYMTWAKYHAGARYNLANSGILGCSVSELSLSLADLQINGPNHEGYAPLKEAIAAQYGVTTEEVVTSQGTSMANFLALATVLERGDEVLLEHPVYEPIMAAAQYLGAEVKRFHRTPANHWQVDLDELRQLISPRTRLIVLTSPHNPSGVPVERASLQAIGAMAAEVGARVLVDEVYRDILFEDAAPVVASLGPHFITTSSLTKSYGLSGLRCGWILCAPALAERMRRLNDIFGSVGSMPSDALAVAAFGQLPQLAARTRALMEPNRQLVREFLAAHTDELECFMPAHSMTMFPRLRRHADSQPLHDRLRAYETSIVPGKFFELPQHFRLGFAVQPEDVAVGLQNLARALRELA